MHSYSAYGLTVRSEIALPPLPRAPDGDCDIHIREARIPDPSGDAHAYRNWRAEPGRFVIELGPECRLLVTGGDTIEVDGAQHIDEGQLVSMILGSGLAALLMQRGIIPLHASAVRVQGGALVVMGRSGAGKSTLLATLVERGYPMLADDVLGLVPQETGAPLALPAFPSIRLWQDSLEALGRSADGLPRVRSQIAKYYLPAANADSSLQSILGVVQLTNANRQQIELRAIPASNRVECLSRYFFRKQFLKGMRLQALGFSVATQVARSAPFLRLARPGQEASPDEVADALLEHAKKLCVPQ